VGGSILSAMTPAAAEAKHFILKYILLQEAEKMGSSPEAPSCMHVPVKLSFYISNAA